MEYTILPHGDGGTYTLSLIVRSKKDHQQLHDNLVCRTAVASGFIGDVHLAGHGDTEPKKGEALLEPIDEDTQQLLGLFEQASQELRHWDKELKKITDRRDKVFSTGELISDLHQAEVRREEWRSRWATLRQVMRIQNYEPFND